MVLVVSLVGCSNTAEVKPVDNSKLESLVQPTPTCSKEEFSSGTKLITAQLNALSRSQFKEAYSLASERFRAENTLDVFTSIISSQYAMLLDLKEFRIISCEKNGELFMFSADLIANQSKTYKMEYILSLRDNRWGVEAAAVYE